MLSKERHLSTAAFFNGSTGSLNGFLYHGLWIIRISIECFFLMLLIHGNQCKDYADDKDD